MTFSVTKSYLSTIAGLAVDQKLFKTDDFVSNTGKSLEIEGYEAPIHDFSISIDGVDYTESILNADYALLVVAYNRLLSRLKI